MDARLWNRDRIETERRRTKRMVVKRKFIFIINNFIALRVYVHSNKSAWRGC